MYIYAYDKWTPDISNKLLCILFLLSSDFAEVMDFFFMVLI